MTLVSLPIWIEYLRALSVPAIAFGGLLIAWSNFRLAKQKRSDDLFDRRFQLYSEFERYWLDTGNGANGPESPADIQELLVFASKADLLFGGAVAKHITSLDGKYHDGSPWFPDDNVSEPFFEVMRIR